MATAAEMRLRPAELSFEVLRARPEDATAEPAAEAARGFLRRRRPALARALEITASEGRVLVRATGEKPEEILREARELLCATGGLWAEGEIEVPPDEFALEPAGAPPEDAGERELLRSQVRYFPLPTCEWFEISAGELALTESAITFEPDWVIMPDEEAQKGELHEIPLASVVAFQRGDWWNLPCLIVETERRAYRYGATAERFEVEKVFEVDEWLERLRELLGEG